MERIPEQKRQNVIALKSITNNNNNNKKLPLSAFKYQCDCDGIVTAQYIIAVQDFIACMRSQGIFLQFHFYYMIATTKKEESEMKMERRFDGAKFHKKMLLIPMNPINTTLTLIVYFLYYSQRNFVLSMCFLCDDQNKYMQTKSTPFI